MAQEKEAKTRSSPRAKERKAGQSTRDQAVPSPDKHEIIEQRSACDDRHSRIAVLAYLLYERHGCQEGRDLENWLEAEQQILIQDRGGTRSELKPCGSHV